MKKFNEQLQQQLNKMCATGKLFRSSMTGQQVWDLYLRSFKDDPIFRDPNSSTHNCNLCNNFLRRYGNIVAIAADYSIMSLFDFEGQEEYAPVAEALSKALKAAPIKDVFFETFAELNALPYEATKKTAEKFKLGVDKNFKRYTKEEVALYGVVNEADVYTFEHAHAYLPKAFVDMTGSSIESIMAGYRDDKTVFQRAMETISLDTFELVKDLINQGSLLDGTTHLYKIEQMIPYKRAYDNLAGKDRDNWCWVTSYKLPFAKFRNELIGVLCSELSEGEELNKACQSWNKRVDPVNYMKTTAPITKKQIEEAQRFVEENGYVESFDRRMATIDDIKASEILHVNAGDGKIKSVSIFDKVKPATSTRHKRSEFDGVEEVSIEKFMKDILPGCSNVEVFLSNYHEGNMVSLTTAATPDSKPIFKWPNNYSWTFNGNLAGKSQIKDNVQAAGGKITGVLRCSLQWNDDDTKGIVDLDLHCVEPGGNEIYYGNKTGRTTGWLDVDMIRPSKVGIENITWQQALPSGIYRFYVNNYCGSANTGFKAEIEFNREVFTYYHKTPVSHRASVNIAAITSKNGELTITHYLQETNASREVYGLETNQFHKVNLVCLSPNHWDGSNVGNKHYMFMLEGCKAPTSIRGFHNENLKPELATHRKVLEVLGATHMVNPSDKQLSGLGFNSTVRDEVIVRLQGTHKRVVKIKF